MVARILTYFLILLSVFASFPYAISAESAKKEISVGVVLGLTGPAAQHALSIKNGIEQAKQELARDGWNVRIRYEDDQTDSKKSVSAFKFLSMQGYRLFIGPTWSFQVEAVKTIIERQNQLTLVPAGSSDIEGGSSPAVFNLAPPRSRQTPVIVEWLKRLGPTRVLILTANGVWGEVHAKVFKHAVLQSGGTVVREEQFDYGVDPSFFSTLLSRLNSDSIDLIMTTASANEVSAVIKSRNTILPSATILSTADVNDAVRMGVLTKKDIANNTFVIEPRQSEVFIKKWKDLHGTAPNLYEANGYDALKLLASAVAQVGADSARIKESLRSGSFSNDTSSEVRFDSNGDAVGGEYVLYQP